MRTSISEKAAPAQQTAEMARSLSLSQNTIGTRTKRATPETGGESIDQFGERQDAAAADEALRLHGEGDEGAKRNEPEQAKEQERDELVSRRLVAPAPQHEAQAEECRPAPGDMGVSALGDGRETGQMSIEGEPESFAGRMAERQETRLGAAGAAGHRAR